MDWNEYYRLKNNTSTNDINPDSGTPYFSNSAGLGADDYLFANNTFRFQDPNLPIDPQVAAILRQKGFAPTAMGQNQYQYGPGQALQSPQGDWFYQTDGTPQAPKDWGIADQQNASGWGGMVNRVLGNPMTYVGLAAGGVLGGGVPLDSGASGLTSGGFVGEAPFTLSGTAPMDFTAGTVGSGATSGANSMWEDLLGGNADPTFFNDYTYTPSGSGPLDFGNSFVPPGNSDPSFFDDTYQYTPSGTQPLNFPSLPPGTQSLIQRLISSGVNPASIGRLLTGGRGGAGGGSILDQIMGAAPSALTTNYLLNNLNGINTNNLQGLYNRYNPEANAAPYDMATATGRDALTSSLEARGVSGSSFGDQSMAGFNTLRDAGRANVINQGVSTQAGIGQNIAADQLAQFDQRRKVLTGGLFATGNGALNANGFGSILQNLIGP